MQARMKVCKYNLSVEVFFKGEDKTKWKKEGVAVVLSTGLDEYNLFCLHHETRQRIFSENINLDGLSRRLHEGYDIGCGTYRFDVYLPASDKMALEWSIANSIPYPATKLDVVLTNEGWVVTDEKKRVISKPHSEVWGTILARPGGETKYHLLGCVSSKEYQMFGANMNRYWDHKFTEQELVELSNGKKIYLEKDCVWFEAEFFKAYNFCEACRLVDGGTAIDGHRIDEPIPVKFKLVNMALTVEYEVKN